MKRQKPSNKKKHLSVERVDAFLLSVEKPYNSLIDFAPCGRFPAGKTGAPVSASAPLRRKQAGRTAFAQLARRLPLILTFIISL